MDYLRKELLFVACLVGAFYAQAHHLTFAVWLLAIAAVIAFVTSYSDA